MFEDLHTLLNDEELDLLKHKLSSARRQHAIVSGNCFILCDGLSEDWPYNERISVNQYGTPEWYAAVAMSNAQMKLGIEGQRQDDARMDLVDLIGFFG